MSTNMGYRNLFWDNPNYSKLFFARTLSLFGVWLNLLALFAMLREVAGTSAEVIGGIFIMKIMPAFIMGPVVGVVVDRFRRQAVLILINLLRVLVILGYFLVPLFPKIAIPMTLVLAFTQTCCSSFFEPARAALLPSLVPRGQLPHANALDALMWSVMYALGVGAGGLVTYLLGWRTVLILEISALLVGALLIARIRYQSQKQKREGKGWKHILGLRDLKDGFKYVNAHPRVAYTIFFKSGWGLAGAMPLVLTLFGERIYDLGQRPDLGVAVLFVARAFGSAVGPLIGRFLTGDDPEHMRRAVLACFLMSSSSYAGLAFATNHLTVLVLIFVANMGGSLIWVFSSILLQWMVPDRFRGRVFAAELAVATLVISASTFLFSRVLEQAVVPLSLAPLGAGLLLFSAGGLLVAWGYFKGLRGQFKSIASANGTNL